MSGARRLVIGKINKDLKGEEYLKAVGSLATADGCEEVSEEPTTETTE